MRVERLGTDKIRIFLTFDDLSERGIEKEDMWRDIPKVHELFNDMMEQAYHELGFEVSGPVAVEVFALPAQGMVVIVTRGKTGARSEKE
ncbi:MAG: adaptor protein MecA, partial [Clostridia bacterium]